MHSLAHNTWRSRGACWSSGMGLGRIDKLIHSHGPAHNPHKVVSTQLEHLWCWDNHGQHGHTRLTTARTWGKPSPSPLQYSLRHVSGTTSKWLFFPGVPKSRPAGLLRLWSPITLRAKLGQKCGLKQSCSSRRELSNGMSHVVCI